MGVAIVARKQRYSKILACQVQKEVSCIGSVFLLPGMIRCGVLFDNGQKFGQPGTKQLYV